MTPNQLELFVVDAVEAALRGEHGEDSRVEFKSVWPEPVRLSKPDSYPKPAASAQLAGHANACRGDSFVWVIGVDEDNQKVVGAAREDLQEWWPQLKAGFVDDVEPDLIQAIPVSVGGGRVVAIEFGATRKPYVVKDGPNTNRVPWRDGALTRSASRRELLRLLRPEVQAPILRVEGTERFGEGGRTGWKVRLFIAARERMDILNHWSSTLAGIVSSVRPYGQQPGLTRSPSSFALTEPSTVELRMLWPVPLPEWIEVTLPVLTGGGIRLRLKVQYPIAEVGASWEPDFDITALSGRTTPPTQP